MTGPVTSSIALRDASRGDQPIGHVALDVLDDDDGVVHDDADRQHQAEQRQVVQREAQQRHDGERADQRHGHGDHRDDRGPPVLQEHQHDDEDQDERLDQRVVDARDRLVDEHGRVVDDLVVSIRYLTVPSGCFALWEALAQLVHPLFDRVGRGQGVRAG